MGELSIKRREELEREILSQLGTIVEDTIVEGIDCHRLAEIAGYSHRTLLRLCMKHYNMSLRDFIWKHRVKAMARMVTEGNLSTSELIEDLRIYDKQAVNRHFMRHIGMTPSQLKKDYRENR